MKRVWGTMMWIALPSLTACTSHPLTGLDQASNVIVAEGAVNAQFCTDAPAPAKQYVKYLIVMDHSASNQASFSTTDVSSSDITGAFRYGQLAQFVQAVPVDANQPTSFALIDFNSTALQAGGNVGFQGASDFMTTLTNDWYPNGTNNPPAPADSGFTNYQSALSAAYALVRADAQAMAVLPEVQGAKTSYILIFVTDGVPTISSGGSLYTQQYSTDIAPVIAQIMGLTGDAQVGPAISSITLNTALYYNASQPNLSASDFDAYKLAAGTILGQMALAGQGVSLSFVSGANGLYQSFALPSRYITNQLVDVFTQNENTVWWTDGSFLPDADADGLPDLIEAQLGSNAGVKDSDGNGVSDLVEYRTKGRACDAAGCASTGRDPYAICAGFSPVTDANGNVTFQSSSNDGLNDCEKFLLGALRTKFNSNGSLIPDFFAFVSQLPIIPGSMSAAFSDPFGDGVQNYGKLKLGFPISISDRNLPDGFNARNVVLTQTASADPTVSCYSYQVDHIAMAAETNTVRVMIVQNSSAVQNKPYLKSARGVISVNSPVASFSNGDFK